VLLVASGSGLLILTAFMLNATDPFPGYLALAPVTATAMLIIGGTVSNPISGLLKTRWLEWLGDVSYGWYLWHWPAIVFTRLMIPNASATVLTVAALAALGPTWLSYRFVEQPIRLNRRIVGRRAIYLAIACILISGSTFGGLRLYARHPDAGMASLVSQYQVHYDQARACAGNFPDAAGKTPTCTWSVPNPRGTILLLGDSNAGQFAEAVQASANGLGYDFAMATYGGCLVAPLQIQYTSQPYDSHACEQFTELWSSAIVQTGPSLVVLASASGAYLTSDSVSLVVPATGAVAHSEIAKREAYSAALKSQLATWAKAGVPTLVVHQLPHFPAFDLRECPSVRIWSDPTSCGQTITVANAKWQVASSNSAENTSAREVPSTGVLDLMGTVCDDERCSSTRGDDYLYRDSAHISVPFAITLSPRFRSAMKPLLDVSPKP
jgi:hypothetical protein